MRLAALAAAAVLLVAPGAARALDIPALTGPVVDRAGMLDARDAARLDRLCRAAWALPPDHRVQLQYLIVPSLEGDTVDDYAVRVFEKWKLGESGKDNGVLVVVSRDDRKIRIETGYGNEGALTDALAGRIIRGTVAPAFRDGRYGDGLYDAGVAILSALGAMPQGVAQRRQAPSSFAPGLLVIGLLVTVLMLRVFTSFGPPRRRFGWGGWGMGGWGGGRSWGGGGWGGGGGGWGGGGGSSGGGGASGGW